MKKIINIILSILLTICIIAEISYTAVATSITEKSIKTNIKENLLTGFMYDRNGNKTEIFNTILKLTTLNEETVKKIMDNETANNIITDIVNSIYDYNLTKDETVKYTEQKLVDTLTNNIDKILSEINYTLSKKDKEEVIEYTKTHAKDILETIYSTEIGDYEK